MDKKRSVRQELTFWCAIVLAACLIYPAVVFGLPKLDELISGKPVKEVGISTVGTPTGKVVDTSPLTRTLINNYHVEYGFVVDGKTYIAYGKQRYDERDKAQNHADSIGDVVVLYRASNPEDYYIDDYKKPIE